MASTSSVCYEQVCEGRVNGLHAVPHASCRAFFHCFNGALTQLDECPRHQIFDGQRCSTSTNFTCWTEGRGSCEGRDDGFHVDSDSDCRGFFLCRHQQFIRAFICSPGLVFNGQECVDDQNSICTSRPHLPDCSTKIDGYYTVENSGCQTFFYCQGESKMSEHTCPGTNVFNGEQCVDPVLYRCPGRAGPQHFRNFTNRVVRSRRTRDNDCGSRSDGYYLDVTSYCRRFFYCHSGSRMFVQTCPQQQRFNGVRCVPEDSYRCPVTPNAAECALRGDGVYQDLSKSCSYYYQCITGKKLMYSCPEGQLHNGHSCQPASKVHCPPPTLCHHRSNGHFTDTDQGCRGHFLCQFEMLMWYLGCGEGEVYNGQECVSHLSYTCPASLSIPCLSKLDGFYQDISTG